MTKVNQSRIREALTAGTNVKEKGPPVADGILSVTPDTPEMLEWRSRSALDVAETSSTFLDDEDDGPKPHELYGKFTWKIENFSEISKRELRSNVFDVGSYKWYILVYPQGCDVCNHLSLFLCVADYDKLLPGWSHFAQFTIAVVNKDPKKSKYSDTLHRFCKKEHDWGWKKFMELSKVLDGFTVADTLVIKAQVQVILDKPSKPFRCLDPQYRRELVRVYLTNVEGICRRFCDDKKARLSWAREEALSFRQFWGSLPPEQQRKYLTDKGDVILKAVVKQFFNEKEVTSTLVMDALYSGCKQIEEHSRTWLEGKCSENAPVVLIKAERSTFTLCGDLMEIADRVQKDFIPAAKDDSKALQPNDGLTLRSGQDGDDYRRDSIERDEKRLAELGRKTIEMFVIAHIFCEKLEIAYREAEALKRQDQLIAEEFEMARLEESKAQAKAQADKEKKAKKKEKLKLKKEAEKLKREAEEAERRAREEEARRQETERKAKEAEKRRLEEAQAQSQTQHAQQQPHGRKGSKALAREERRAQQAAVQLQQQQQQQAKAKQAAAAAASTSAQQQQSLSSPHQPQQQQQHVGSTKPSAQAADRAAAASTAGGPPSLAALAAAAAAADSAAAAASAAAPAADLTQADRPDSQAEESPSECSSSSGEEEVGTVNQATGAAESSGDGEDEAAAASSAAGGPGGTLSESEGASDSEGRAALEEEVTILRAQVVQLEKLLAERDAELFALRAQLSELQPTEIADMVKEAAAAAAGTSAAAAAAAAGHVAGVRGNASTSSAPSTSSGVPVDGGAMSVPGPGPSSLGPGPAGPSGVAAREPAMAESSQAASSVAATSGVGRAEQHGKVEPAALANGPAKDGHRSDVMSPPMVAAAMAAAALRRAHQAAASHDPSALLHPGSVPGRQASSGPGPNAAPSSTATAASTRIPGVAAAAAQPRPAGSHHAGTAAGEAAVHHAQSQALGSSQQQQPQQQQPQQPQAPVGGPVPGSSVAATSGENHIAAPPPSMMQRSTSATLPSLASASAAAASPSPYAPLAGHPLAAAGPTAATATANGRPRATTPLDGAPASGSSGPASAAPNGTAGKVAAAAGAASAAASPFIPQSQSTAAGSSMAASANGIAGVLHSSASTPAVPDGLPSYRNAAAGVLGSGQPGAASMMPVSPSGAAAGAHKRVEDSAGTASSAAAAARHMGHAVGPSPGAAADGAFSANARIMMQQAQRAGLTFGTPTSVQSASAKQRMTASAQLDSPGLEDFAHINMIDDLLTE